MASEAKGYLIVPVWCNDGIITPLANDDGKLSVLTDADESDIFARLQGYLSSGWTALNFIFSYYDRLAPSFREQKSGAGTYYVELFEVPENYVYVVRNAFILNETTVAGKTTIQFRYTGVNMHIYSNTPTATWESINYNMDVPFKEGDSLYWEMTNCNNGDWIRSGCWGYKMKVG